MQALPRPPDSSRHLQTRNQSESCAAQIPVATLSMAIAVRVSVPWLAFIAPLLPIAATAASGGDKDGQYFCVVEHLAGITFSHDGANRTVLSGKVTIPESDMKFFIKVGPKKYDDTRREICAADIDWIKKVFERGMPYPDHGPNVDDRQWIGPNCFTSSEITWSPLEKRYKGDYKFEGYGGPYYYGAQPETWFVFEGDSFNMGMFYDNGPVIEYGHCTKIEPPK
jgi:hypothetical protein